MPFNFSEALIQSLLLQYSDSTIIPAVAKANVNCRPYATDTWTATIDHADKSNK